MHRRLSRTRLIYSLLIIATALLLASCTGTDNAAAGAGRIVALGDSSASGPGLGPKYPDAPPECDRTFGGYPALLAARVLHESFTNETCSGAISSSLQAGSTYPSGNRVRAQLDALNGTESVVLLSLGDNDADFGTVTNNCLWHNFSSNDVCTQTYVQGGSNTLIPKARAIKDSLAGAISSIKQRAPKAKVFLVGYIDLAPRNAAGCAGLLWLTGNDAPVFDDWEVAVNETLRSVAAENGAYFVDVYARSGGHTACAPVPAERWVNNYVGPSEMVALHPTAAGAEAVAGIVVDAMQAAGVELRPEARIEPLAFRRMQPAARGGVFTRNQPPRGGAALPIKLDLVGRVSLKLERVSSGRLAGGHCRAATRKNRRRPPCARTASRGGWWEVSLPAGRTEVYVSGRLRGRKLAKGRYRVRIKSDSLLVSSGTTEAFTLTR